MTVLTQKIDGQGWLWESSRSDRPMVKTNRRATLKHHPDGRGYWVMGDLTAPADAVFNNPQIMAQNNNQFLAQQAAAQEAQKRQNAIQVFKKMQQDIFEMLAEKLNDSFRGVQMQQLGEAIVKIHVLIREANSLGVQDVSGLERFVKFASAERDRRFLQGQANNNGNNNGDAGGGNLNPAAGAPAMVGEAAVYSQKLGVTFTPVKRPNGLLGAKVIQAPRAGTPAASVGLEVGDIIIGLDGQGFRNFEDIEAHYGQSTIQIINVRTNQRQEIEEKMSPGKNIRGLAPSVAY